MRIDWKVSAISASAAFLLSVLVGIIGGVSFGALLVRAVIGAIVFGAGAIGVSVAIDRFLPELRTATVDSSDSPGGKVDIVVERDDSDVLVPVPLVSEIGDNDQDDLAGDLTDSVDDGDSLEELSGEASGESHSETRAGDPADGIADPADGIADPGSDKSTNGDGDLGDGESEDVEELAAADKLPDVEGFAESFSESPTEVTISSVDSGTDPADDPAVMAKAIRTLLKREE